MADGVSVTIKVILDSEAIKNMALDYIDGHPLVANGAVVKSVDLFDSYGGQLSDPSSMEVTLVEV